MIAPKQIVSTAVFLLAASMAAAPVWADKPLLVLPPAYLTNSVIDGSVFSGANGNIAVNLAAGDANVQLNAASLAASFGAGIAQAGIYGFQYTEKTGASPDSAICTIGGDAFANVSGITAINQASGQGNAQANGVAIALGLGGAEAIAESSLGAITTGQWPDSANGEDSSNIHQASVEETAFVGARGLVQINQLAGSGNATANNFAVRVSLGGVPD